MTPTTPAAEVLQRHPLPWTPASTPPTGTGWYVVLPQWALRTGDSMICKYTASFGWQLHGKVTHYLPAPLPPLPEKEST